MKSFEIYNITKITNKNYIPYKTTNHQATIILMRLLGMTKVQAEDSTFYKVSASQHLLQRAVVFCLWVNKKSEITDFELSNLDPNDYAHAQIDYKFFEKVVGKIQINELNYMIIGNYKGETILEVLDGLRFLSDEINTLGIDLEDIICEFKEE